MNNKSLNFFVFCLIFYGFIVYQSRPAFSQDDKAYDVLDELEEQLEEEESSVIYEMPTLKSLSQLYWALNKFDPSDDKAVDNYLMINECDLYTDYAQNEFEWTGIREAGRVFLMDNRQDFPLHFEYIQPIQFAEYDLDTGLFDIWEPNKIHGIRRFEVMAEDVYEDVCGMSYGWDLHGYPKGLHVELNRPFTLDQVAVKPEAAKEFIELKQEIMNRIGYKIYKKEDLYEARDAYLVMKIRMFSYKAEEKLREVKLARVLGVLEGYEIYGDLGRNLLMYSENYRRKKKRSDMENEMKKRYQERLKKKKEEEANANAEGLSEAGSP